MEQRRARPRARACAAVDPRPLLALLLGVLATALTLLGAPPAHAAAATAGTTAGPTAPAPRTAAPVRTPARDGASAVRGGQGSGTTTSSSARSVAGVAATGPRTPHVAPPAGSGPGGAHHSCPAGDGAALPPHVGVPAPPLVAVLPPSPADPGSAGRSVVPAAGRSPPAAAVLRMQQTRPDRT